MFGLEFLFSAALWALPVAGVPILLHLLFRKKAPIVHFSTLRFIRASIQKTAARKRLQRWLLLACRVLLLALLVWALAQPARKATGEWAGSSRSLVAAVVVDTSYSMELMQDQTSILARANDAVEDLLREPLNHARVAVFRSASPSSGEVEQLRPAAQILSEWTPLKPQPSQRPLLDRVAAAAELLRGASSGEKWLIVISDLQSKEFPRPIAAPQDCRLIFIDLHPQEARSAGITRVALEPPQPTPGIRSEILIDIAGRRGDSRAVTTSLLTPSGKVLSQSPPLVANIDDSGRAKLRFPISLPAQPWVVVRAALQSEDDLAWDNSRTHLIDVPKQQNVAVLQNPAFPAASRFVRLALDPMEGKTAAWPLKVSQGPEITAASQVIALLADAWPAMERGIQLRDFVRNGGTLIWFLRPALEEVWSTLPEQQKTVLRELLPSAPLAGASMADANIAAASKTDDPLLAGLTDERYQISSIAVHRYVPLERLESPATELLNVSPKRPTGSARPRVLLARHPLGAGTVYTFTTLPEGRFSSVATHPIFLPLLVRMSLRPAEHSDAQNVQLGQPLTARGDAFKAARSVRIEGPGKEITEVKPRDDETGRRFVFAATDNPGLYTWRKTDGNDVLAIANVQLPASEAELVYRDAASVVPPGPNSVIARSVADLKGQLDIATQPQPRWSLPIAIVMFLLCLEAFMGSTSKLWKPLQFKSPQPQT